MKRHFLSMRKVFALSCALCLSPLTSCSSFFGGDEFTITNIEQTTNEETGDITITITFNDESVAPLTFTIPKVTNGTDGNGISNIIPTLNNDNVVLTISYTDTNKEDTVISIPVVKGDDGNGIIETKVGTDDDGNTTIEFKYSNGTSSGLITIPKGLDGKDGIGIAEITCEPNDNGNILLSIYFSDASIPPYTYEIQNGVSIANVVYNEDMSDNENYALNIIFSNGEQTTIYLPRPKSTRRYSGFNNPDPDEGFQGDFYVNLTNGDIYYKLNDSNWSFMFNMKGSGSTEQKEEFSVRFNLLEGETCSDYSANSTIIFNILEGDNLELSKIPIPQKEGFDFVGWFSEDSANPNAGHFTDLTIVNRDFNLYARRK